ncbi:MAG: hypothetical protein DRR42_12175 [Gammaproteobacteria bacterium]|nr:MAG: hypothetical protein DRR42_12175 [Gammaproteobacteria bacterium]
MLEIDEMAKSEAITRWVMPESVHLPIAARDKESIVRYIGSIVSELSMPNTDKAFLVEVPPPSKIDEKLALWDVPESKVLHRVLQVWVHVDYRGYRRAYSKAFPDEDISNLILDHIENRRMARVKGYPYVRILPISKSANSSSGALSEKWGYDYHNTPEMRKKNREKNQFIQYADLSSLVKMLNMNTGGGVMDAVNEAQSLLLQK